MDEPTAVVTRRVPELWELEPTPRNIRAVLHRLWGHAKAGEYRKDEWAAFDDLVERHFQR